MALPWPDGNRKDRLAYPVSVGKNFSLLHEPSVPNHSNLHITNSLSTTNAARIVAAGLAAVEHAVTVEVREPCAGRTVHAAR